MARRKPAAAIAAPQVTIPTIIEFLLDETGSMASCKNETVAGFNDFLAEQQKQTGSCLLTLTKFDTHGQRTPYIDIDVNMVPMMQSDWFIPGASTNLRDTIGNRIQSLKARLANWTVKPNILFVVMTDGGDNASYQYNEQYIRNAISEYMDDSWTFVYLGADQNAIEIASKLGFPEGNVKSFASTKMRETMQDLGTATTAYRSTRTSATTASTRSFF